MTDKENIDHKIKEGFESISQKAPSNIWNNITEKFDLSDSDINIDNKIKESFEDQSSYAPEKIWGNVNKQLNIDNTWKKISLRLDKQPFIFWSRIAVATIIILIIFFKINSDINKINDNYSSSAIKHNNTKNTNIKSVKPILSENYSAIKQITDKDNLRNKNVINMNSETNYIENSNNQNNLLANNISHNILQNKFETKEIPTVDKLNMKNPTIIGVPNNTYMTKRPDSLLQDDYFTENLIKPRKYEFGIIYSLHNTWLFNNETKKSFDNNSLINSSTSYTGNYGLLFSYYLNENSALTTELYVQGKIKQEYGMYVEGKYYNKDIELNYSQITLLYQYNINQMHKIPSSYSFKTGFYVSNFTKKQSSFSENIVEELSDISKLDYGVKLAIGHKSKFNRFAFEYGFDSEYGIKNIFLGNEQIPSDFNKTHPFYIGVYINLLYKL